MGKYVPLKFLFNEELAEKMADSICKHDPTFSKRNFVSSVTCNVENLELKQRIEVMADELHNALQKDFNAAIHILLKILGPENTTEVGTFTNGYMYMPIAKYVEKYGLNDFETSFNTMYEITKRNTAEYAIRPFLETYHEDTLDILQQWIHDENSHIRRLVSEGTRPRLPWAKKIGALKGDFKYNLQLLEPLMNDPSKYVQKSVANHINDITKEDKELVFQWLQQLRDKQHPVNPWIIKHGLRTVIKNGNLPKDFSF
ncbi:DNA alkylation repair enzyme family protein [Bacillus cereus ATCC 4342]|uniref:DNA alkylation repair protein n=1 Tax=Bacillus tropicus TaxID=2026188 RepID=UPI0001A01CE6|nr:DNA alkylation repair protein [Bacillus tropicus]AJH76468.1 DNA alkylation repair enzyme family protein [Bacillus cereus ATCC 4342]EEK83558.1 DNA alkylation repair enzyme [Bacillus cereus ATCC 4342]KFM88263.1 DNA alkylation repair enzyme family protein [Bacillus cereus ATCC 4342]MDR4453485.1 DNA alkylation repair protein [Bacillus tropicus]QKH57100.1 DNA alkylation repair protein [Bacillus tropicus]